MKASREYQIKDTRWKQEFQDRAPRVFEQKQVSEPQKERIAELERTLGRMTLELDMAKKVFGSSRYLSKDDE